MNSFHLSLRQRQLINCLMHAEGFVTGTELARRLNVSARTVRTDVSELNDILKKSGIQIISRHHFGYTIKAQDEACLRDLTQTAASYISREERLHHLVLRLSLSEHAIDLDDLADEMYISKATLENDLKSFRKEFLLKYPFVLLIREKNRIRFENDERKKRIMLCQLYADSWDYTSYGNALYQYEYLDEKTVRYCMEKLNYYLQKYRIRIEDTNLVHLNLMLAIAIRRISDGHFLKERKKDLFVSDSASVKRAVTELLDDLGSHFSCTFSEIEQEDVLEMVSCGELPDMDEIRRKGAASCFSRRLLSLADSYLDTVRITYGPDFRHDEDFYLTLLLYLRYLGLPIHYLNETGVDRTYLMRKYSIEMELAFAIEPYALSYYGNYLDDQELLYLSLLISGALLRMPFSKIHTVILSQHNEPAAWNLRMQIEDRFSSFLTITDLSPVYGRNPAVADGAELVISTVKKSLPEFHLAKTLCVSPWFDQKDFDALENCIRHFRFQRLYGRHFPSLKKLLEEADWLEMLDITDYFDLLLFMGTRFLEKGYVDERYLEDLLHRNSLISFFIQPSFLLVHSSVPARETHIEVATLSHRLRINGQKVRTVMMFCMTREDMGLTFKLYNDLYHGISDPESTSMLKTKKEWMDYLDALKENS